MTVADWQSAKYPGQRMVPSPKREVPRDEWPEVLRTLGGRVKFARERFKPAMTRVALAKLSKIDATTIGRIEDGTRLAHVSALIGLAEALHVSVGWLLGNEGALPEAPKAPPGTADRRRRAQR